MIRVDFDQPAYLRASKGLAILSSRLQHLLPKVDEQYQATPAEPVIINRLFAGSSVMKAHVDQSSEENSIKGEFIPWIARIRMVSNSTLEVSRESLLPENTAVADTPHTDSTRRTPDRSS